jgi:hypothetical protein
MLIMSAVTELILLSFAAVAAGAFALVAGDLAFALLFTVMSWFAFIQVVRHGEK